MSQRERNEWIERAKERVLRNAKETDTYARDIMDLYDETANQLENEINAMFQKYAQDNKLDNAEAEKLLSSEEYSRWRKSMDKYVAEAQTDSRTLLELNTLSAKSRISRKEQLLSQIYFQMMNLAGDTETKLTDLEDIKIKKQRISKVPDEQLVQRLIEQNQKTSDHLKYVIHEWKEAGLYATELAKEIIDFEEAAAKKLKIYL